MKLPPKLQLSRPTTVFWGYAFIILAIVLPWFLKPGYLFFIDFVWSPKIIVDWHNSWVVFYIIIKALSYFLASAFIQKFILSLILLTVLLGGRRLVKGTFLVFNGEPAYIPNKWLVFVLSLFALFNPFVYDRLMYGQVGVVASFGFLLLALGYLLPCFKRINFKGMIWFGIFSGLTILFSIHSIFFLIIIFSLFIISALFKPIVEWRTLLKSLFFIAIIILIINLSWLISSFGKSSRASLDNISRQDLIAFQTAGKTPVETVSNVLLMSGFWGKEQFRYFDLTDAHGWQRSFLLLTPIILYGVWISFRKRERAEKMLSIGLLIIFVLAVMLAVGIKTPIARDLTLFLYDHLPFYKGFREPQKWVAVIVPIYLFYLTVGISHLKDFKLIQSKRYWSAIILGAIIIMQAPSLLWGFNRQINSTEYPNDWHEVNKFLVGRSAQSDSCSDRVLFLPWHMYMSFNWVGKVIANPASSFFSCPVVSGTNMEFGGIYDNSRNADSAAIDAWLAKQGRNKTSAMADAPVLTGAPIHYIILAKEVDWENYTWLNNLSYLRLIKETPTLFVYEINF